MDIPTSLPGGIKAHMFNVVLPELPPGCQNSFCEAVARGKFQSMPNSFLPPPEQKVPGLLFLSNVLNMQHLLTGGSMTVAFSDVLLISKLHSPANAPSLDYSNTVPKQIGWFHWAWKQSSSLINILAMALYMLFMAQDSTFSALKNRCFSILLDWWEVQARTLQYAGGSYTVAMGACLSFLCCHLLFCPACLGWGACLDDTVHSSRGGVDYLESFLGHWALSSMGGYAIISITQLGFHRWSYGLV